MEKVNRARGDRHPNWKGGLAMSKDGYVMVRALQHPYVNHNGYVRRARLVMEASLGRYVLPGEHIHHVNRDKTDDRLENLRVLTAIEHGRLHGHDVRGEACPFAKLTEEDVREIRACYTYESGASLSRRFGVTAATICDVQQRRNWKHVSSEAP